MAARTRCSLCVRQKSIFSAKRSKRFKAVAFTLPLTTRRSKRRIKKVHQFGIQEVPTLSIESPSNFLRGNFGFVV